MAKKLVETSNSILFAYARPTTAKITYVQMRKALADVRDQLLSHDINGGEKHLDMTVVCDSGRHSCGMAACVGGWTSLFILGFDGAGVDEADAAERLFDTLIHLDHKVNGDHRLSDLFHQFSCTNDYNEPNVAATAIHRYLKGNAHPWPEGDMPNVLPYTKKRK